MNCSEFAEIVQELARNERPGQLDAALAAAGQAHAWCCPTCAERLAEAEWAAMALKVASAESRLLTIPAQVDGELLEAFRHARSSGYLRRRSQGPWRLAFGWAALAAVVVLIAIAVVYRLPGLRHWEARAIQHTKSAVVPARASSGRKSVSAVAVEQAGREDLAEQELSTGFVAVPYAGSFEAGDSAVVVRVQMPRGALADLGYPVDESTAGEMVQADLLVGEDGWPYAVRIVP